MNESFLSRNYTSLELVLPLLWRGVAAFWISARLILAALMVVVACSGTTFAAARSGPIAVLDIVLQGTSIEALDKGNVEPKGMINVYKNHATPTLPDGNLDLEKLRAGTSSLIDAPIDLKVRGSSSRFHAKKSYSLDFKNTVSLLGMPAETEWVLHSCWADKTCLRNVIGYWQAAKLFPWAPQTEFAEVFINGEYRGLYVVVEKIKLGPGRVNLPPPDDNAFNGGITGTYILKRDGNDQDFNWQSTVDPSLRWWFVSPKRNLSQAQIDYIKRYMNVSFEPRFNPSYVVPPYDPWNYDEWVYGQSAADFVIIQEIANNVDAYWKSMHITKQRLYPGEGLIRMGPIWDLDLAFGNYYDPNYRQLCRTDSWRMELPSGLFQPLSEMWKVPKFRRAIYDRWRELARQARSLVPMAKSDAEAIAGNINGKIDASAARIANARERDIRKWSAVGIPPTGVQQCGSQLNPTLEMYSGEVAELKRWIRARIDWMHQRISASSFLNP